MTAIFCHKALLADGWTDNVRLEVEGDLIGSVDEEAVPRDADVITGCVIPGLCNAHSHAFQRALVGWTEERSPAGRDNFWTWRERMYAFAAEMDADRLRRIARQAYIEMLSCGYTSVAEFHYLHRDPTDDSDDRMLDAIVAAADGSGIRLTYVPVLYERAGFDRAEPEGAQALFALDLATFLDHAERSRQSLKGRLSTGIGAHSIRAVSRESLTEIAAVSRAERIPMHIHAAEQQREVDQSLAFMHRRPVRWLLENFDVDQRWCFVHATHLDVDEIEQLAASSAVVSAQASFGPA